MPSKTQSGRHRAAEGPRTLHLIDIENLVGGNVTVGNSAALWLAYERVVHVERGDQVVVAAAGPGALEARLGIARGVQLLAPLAGPDAADLALLDAWKVDEVAQRFDRVVIGSGDHIFRAYARNLRLSGLCVEQATSAGYCSASLYRVCTRHYDLSRPTTPATAA